MGESVGGWALGCGCAGHSLLVRESRVGLGLGFGFSSISGTNTVRKSSFSSCALTGRQRASASSPPLMTTATLRLQEHNRRIVTHRDTAKVDSPLHFGHDIPVAVLQHFLRNTCTLDEPPFRHFPRFPAVEGTGDRSQRHALRDEAVREQAVRRHGEGEGPHPVDDNVADLRARGAERDRHGRVEGTKSPHPSVWAITLFAHRLASPPLRTVVICERSLSA